MNCTHDWRWVRDSIGDRSEPSTLADCSGWRCRLCDEEPQNGECDDMDRPEPRSTYPSWRTR